MLIVVAVLAAVLTVVFFVLPRQVRAGVAQMPPVSGPPREAHHPLLDPTQDPVGAFVRVVADREALLLSLQDCVRLFDEDSEQPLQAQAPRLTTEEADVRDFAHWMRQYPHVASELILRWMKMTARFRRPEQRRVGEGEHEDDAMVYGLCVIVALGYRNTVHEIGIASSIMDPTLAGDRVAQATFTKGAAIVDRLSRDAGHPEAERMDALRDAEQRGAQ